MKLMFVLAILSLCACGVKKPPTPLYAFPKNPEATGSQDTVSPSPTPTAEPSPR